MPVDGVLGEAQLEDSLAALNTLSFTAEDLAEIDSHASEGGVDLWKVSSELAPGDLP